MTVTNAGRTDRRTAAEFTSADPTLAKGVEGVEEDTGWRKQGDGSTAWTSLAYYPAHGGDLEDQLADDTAFTAKYAPLIDSVWIGAAAMAPSSAASLATTMGGAVWRLDASSAESVGFNTESLPSHWVTFNVELFWTNLGAGSGDVRFFWIDGGANVGIADGASSALAWDAQSDITAPAQNVLKVSQLISGKAVGSGDLYGFRVDRDATASEDTLANDCGIMGVRLVKAS